MMDKMRVMVYVDDVERCVRFWQDYLDAQVAEFHTLPDGSKNVVLKLTDTVELAFFATAFIERYSPEVQTNFPSLMLFSDRFNELHHRLPNTSRITDQHGQLTFDFADPEGHHFVIAKA